MSDHGFVVQEGQVFEVLHPPDQVPEGGYPSSALQRKVWSCLLTSRGCVENGTGDAGKFPSDLNGEFAESERWTTLKYSRRSAEHLAVVPDRGALVLVGPHQPRPLSSVWLGRALNKYFALGVSMFSMIVYNRVIPSNAGFAACLGIGNAVADDRRLREDCP